MPNHAESIRKLQLMTHKKGLNLYYYFISCDRCFLQSFLHGPFSYIIDFCVLRQLVSILSLSPACWIPILLPLAAETDSLAACRPLPKMQAIEPSSEKCKVLRLCVRTVSAGFLEFRSHLMHSTAVKPKVLQLGIPQEFSFRCGNPEWLIWVSYNFSTFHKFMAKWTPASSWSTAIVLKDLSWLL